MENKVYDLKKLTYLYALEIIKFLEDLSGDYISHTIGKQLLRSATSIGANIEERKTFEFLIVVFTFSFLLLS